MRDKMKASQIYVSNKMKKDQYMYFSPLFHQPSYTISPSLSYNLPYPWYSPQQNSPTYLYPFSLNQEPSPCFLQLQTLPQYLSPLRYEILTFPIRVPFTHSPSYFFMLGRTSTAYPEYSCIFMSKSQVQWVLVLFPSLLFLISNNLQFQYLSGFSYSITFFDFFDFFKLLLILLFFYIVQSAFNFKFYKIKGSFYSSLLILISTLSSINQALQKNLKSYGNILNLCIFELRSYSSQISVQFYWFSLFLLRVYSITLQYYYYYKYLPLVKLINLTIQLPIPQSFIGNKESLVILYCLSFIH